VTIPEQFRPFDDAQRRAIALTSDVVRRLEAGMSERDIHELAETRLGSHGFSGWYHAPEVRVRPFGDAGLLRRPSATTKLEPGDMVSIDVGPADGSAYGDFGTTVTFAAADDTEATVLSVARDCIRASCGYSSRWKTMGEIVIFAQAWAVNHRMTLAQKENVGHRIIAKEGWTSVGFPKSAHAATLMRRNQLHRLNPTRMNGMFAIRPEVDDKGHRASFEEIVYVDGDAKGVLGRDSLAEVGTLP